MRRLSFIIFTLLFPLFSFAQNGPLLRNPASRINEPQNLIDLLVTIIQILGGPVVVIAIIYGGYKLVSAQGDEKKLEEGKRALIWAVVGAAIILLAGVIQDIVFNTLGDLFP